MMLLEATLATNLWFLIPVVVIGGIVALINFFNKKNEKKK